MPKRLKFLPLLLFPLLASGCSLLSGNVATLWTNQPEFTAYVELFNTSQSRYKIEISYRAHPAQSLVTGSRQPDLVVGERLASVNVIGKFSALDGVFGKGEVQRSQFYPKLLASGRYQGRQRLLPISFDLPVILFEKGKTTPPAKQTTLTLSQILATSKQYNKKSTRSFTVRGFSPLWSPDFVYSTAQLMGSDFHQTTSGNLAWDDQNLKKSIADMRRWVKELDGGAKTESTFREKYLYDPVPKLLKSGRILYYSTTLRKYFAMPAAERKSIGFRWLADGSSIPAVENVLYAGIPAHSHNKGAAYAFLRWFFRPQTQSQLLEMTHYERIKSFGLGGGLSALSVVDDRDFPQHYPTLLGRIPTAKQLVFPSSLPSDWADLKADVIIPWMKSETLSSGSGQTLGAKLKSWRLQKPLP